MAVSEAARRALELINKSFPKCPLSTLSQSSRAKVDSFSSGSLILDRLFGIGGWPKGRIVGVSGRNHTGKSTICLHAIASMQRAGGLCALIDTEQRAGLEYAQSLGVDIDSLVFDQPKWGEDAIEKIKTLLESKAFDLIILDSIAKTKPKVIQESKIESANVGIHAKLITKGLEIVSKNMGNCTFLYTNHIKRGMEGFEYEPGGDAPLFESDLRVKLLIEEKKKDEEEDPTHNIVKAVVLKNSVGGVPYREALFTLRHGQGIAPADDVLDAAVQAGVISCTQNGFYSITINETKSSVARGKEAAIEWLKARDRLPKIRKLVTQSDWFLHVCDSSPSLDQEKEPGANQEGGEVPRDGGETEAGTSNDALSTMSEAVQLRETTASSPMGEAEKVNS